MHLFYDYKSEQKRPGAGSMTVGYMQGALPACRKFTACKHSWQKQQHCLIIICTFKVLIPRLHSASGPFTQWLLEKNFKKPKHFSQDSIQTGSREVVWYYYLSQTCTQFEHHREHSIKPNSDSSLINDFILPQPCGVSFLFDFFFISPKTVNVCILSHAKKLFHKVWGPDIVCLLRNCTACTHSLPFFSVCWLLKGRAATPPVWAAQKSRKTGGLLISLCTVTDFLQQE